MECNCTSVDMLQAELRCSLHRKYLAHRRGDCGRTGCAPAQGLGRCWAGLPPAAPWHRVHPDRPPSERRAAAQTMLNHLVANLLGHRCWPARPAGLVAQAKGRRLAAAARAPAAAAGCCSMMALSAVTHWDIAPAEHGRLSCAPSFKRWQRLQECRHVDSDVRRMLQDICCL